MFGKIFEKIFPKRKVVEETFYFVLKLKYGIDIQFDARSI